MRDESLDSSAFAKASAQSLRLFLCGQLLRLVYNPVPNGRINWDSHKSFVLAHFTALTLLPLKRCTCSIIVNNLPELAMEIDDLLSGT